MWRSTVLSTMINDVYFSGSGGSGSSLDFAGNITASNCSFSIPSRTPAFVLALQVVVSTTCVLSAVGATLIVLTYLGFRELRTTARLFLANLSIADVVIATSHFVGLFANYERFLCSYGSKSDWLCTTQAAALMFSTLATFAWTLAIAVYFLSIVVFKTKTSMRSVVVSHLLCWGVPAALTIGYGAAGFLGFDEQVDVGWCYLRRINKHGKQRNPYPELWGYELWTYAVFLLLPVIYLWIECYIKMKLKSRRVLTDIKLLFIPVMFLLLRMWNFILDTITFYSTTNHAEEFKKTHTAAALIMLSGIGDSAQGIVNAILFIGFTKVVRQRFRRLLMSCTHSSREAWTPLRATDQLESRQEVEEEERESEDTSSLDGSSEALRVPNVHFSHSNCNYGTTPSNV